MERLRTLRDLLINSKKEFGDRAAFNIRNKEGYDSITYSEFVDDTIALAASFIELGYSGKRIAVVGENSYRWVVTYLATVSAGAVIVPIDRELQSSEVAGLMTESGAAAAIFSSDYSFHYDGVKESYEGIDCYIMNCADGGGLSRLEDLIEKGRSSSYDKVINVPLDGNALCSIVFTSGTTGISKGAMLSHINMLDNAYSCLEFIRLDGVRLSLLPMHHTYEFTLGVVFYILQGSTIAINHSIKYVSQNLKIFAPDTLLVVPLVAETLYKNIWSNIRNSGKERAVRTMIKVTRFLRMMGIDIRRKVFSKIIDGLGGNLRNVFCGGAHIDEDVAIGYVDFGINFYIGYGITECSPLITANMYCSRKKMNSCGKAISCCEVRIAGGNDTEGEIEAKGSNVMLGYFNNELATSEVMNGEWYRTGDIGKFDKDGDLYITGRIKNIIVLRNGKNIYPEELEGYLYKIPYIKEVLVYGEERNAGEELSLIAEVYINEEKAKEDNIIDIQSVIRERIDEVNSRISFYKRIVEVRFRDVEFKKTTSRKIKRNING